AGQDARRTAVDGGEDRGRGAAEQKLGRRPSQHPVQGLEAKLVDDDTVGRTPMLKARPRAVAVVGEHGHLRAVGAQPQHVEVPDVPELRYLRALLAAGRAQIWTCSR